VKAGKKEANMEIGRYLSDTVAAIPYISPEDFDKMFEDNMQDMLLLMYLSNLMRTQLAIADKLGTQLLPIL
jgi:translation initiation factor 3 subunit F